MQYLFDECVQSTYQSPYGPFAWAGETSFSDAVAFSRAAFHYQLSPAEKNFSKSCDVDDVVGRHSRGSQYELLRSVLIPMNNHGFKPVPLTKMLYSVIETAAILSYSRQVIYDLINSGQLRAVNPLGSKRGLKVPASEIIKFVVIAAEIGLGRLLSKAIRGCRIAPLDFWRGKSSLTASSYRNVLENLLTRMPAGEIVMAPSDGLVACGVW